MGSGIAVAAAVGVRWLALLFIVGCGGGSEEGCGFLVDRSLRARVVDARAQLPVTRAMLVVDSVVTPWGCESFDPNTPDCPTGVWTANRLHGVHQIAISAVGYQVVQQLMDFGMKTDSEGCLVTAHFIDTTIT